MKKLFLLLIAICTINIALNAQTAQIGGDENSVFQQHITSAFGLLGLTSDQESQIRDEINAALFDIEAVKNNEGFTAEEKNH